MVTLTYKKHPRFGVGCRVRAVKNACDGAFEQKAEGIVTKIDHREYLDNRTTAYVKFDKGNFSRSSDFSWWGYREDFKVIG